MVNFESAEPTTDQEAAAILNSIRIGKGHVDEDYRRDLEKLSDEHELRTLQALEKLRENQAAFTKSVSQQLYSSKYRFLYELVQNADDSLYEKARRASRLPFLRFSITPKTFIVETNEDGFTRSNVEAVCATGKSSKKSSAADDHIGEKGFGFKSVFSVAKEVQVQSGLWSFRFKHRKGEDGLGMITPLEADALVLPADVTTRITLRLTKAAIADYQGLLDAVASMPETTIFFLQRLQKFHVHVSDLDAKETATTFERIALTPRMDRVMIRRHQVSSDGTAVDESLFRCFTHLVEDMPEHEFRKGRESARVKLAFPVEPATQQPKISQSGQHVFAYLPLQRLQQIQFLIQSDFVTSINREGISDCAWNAALLQGVAETFATAVESFVEDDDPLKYSWLEYLPTELSDDRWKSICPLITQELSLLPILQTRRRSFKRPRELLLLRDCMLYDGQPILKDISDDVYLASKYKSYRSKVELLGVRQADLSSMVKRLEVDIMKRKDSRLRTTDPSDLWHAAFASMFFKAWSTVSPAVGVQKRLRQLGIIPLQGRQQWAGAPCQSNDARLDNIYLSHVEGVPIPNSIGLSLLDTHASSNPKRKAFYIALGVEECSHELVVDRIKQLHRRSGEHPTNISSHLRYLFHTNVDALTIKPWIWVPTKSGYARNSEKLFFPSEKEYHLYQVLAGTDHSKFEKIVEFLDRSLVNLERKSVNDREISWEAWLQQATGAQYYPSLLHHIEETDSVELSPILKLINKYRPVQFLGTLRAHWQDDYEEDAAMVEADLRVIQARCISDEGQHPNQAPLHKTYLPTTKIMGRALELGISPYNLPILQLPGFCTFQDKLNNAEYRKWRFLEEFGVHHEPDLAFYKRALKEAKLAAPIPGLESLKEIYSSIASLATASDHQDICELFSQELLWIPSSGKWQKHSRCNWGGPDFLRYKSLLQPHYGDDPMLSRFFKGTLDVKDTTTADVVFELKHRRAAPESTTSLATASEIYKYLYENTASDEEWQTLRDLFREKDYILGMENVWHTLKTCVWHMPFLLSGYADLGSTYPELQSFFVKHLKVKKVTPSMLIKEISKMVVERSPDCADVKKRLINVGMMLAETKLDKATKDALDELGGSNFLPKRVAGGDKMLLCIDDTYAIWDHARYGSAFAKHDILLDFSVEEVQIMNVMFEYMGIKRHYLSSLVVEESTVEDDAEEDEDLTQQLQARAYALYCCATKYKSVKALRGDDTLFEMLSSVCVLRGDLATHLVIDEKDLKLHFKVRSDRSYIHHEIEEGYLCIYVPKSPKQSQTCYRSQLTKLLAEIMYIDPSACHDISVIIGSDLKVLDDVLVEHDISNVSWIEKPVLDMHDGENSATSSPSSPDTPNVANAGRRRRASSISSARSLSPSGSTLVDYVTASLRPAVSNSRVSRSSDQADNDRHNGALGEAFVFETLSDLHLTDFTLDNWRSTIRGELSRYPKYAGITNWQGRETADIVYKDCDRELTEWLMEHCTGGYPAGDDERDFAEEPIEYFFEVKSTSGPCESRFFLSTGQYKLMHDMAVQAGQEPTRMYVIVRVFDVLSGDRGMEIFVDPVRLKGTHLTFEAEGWIGRTTL